MSTPLQVVEQVGEAELTLKFMYTLAMKCACGGGHKGTVCPAYLMGHDISGEEYKHNLEEFVDEYKSKNGAHLQRDKGGKQQSGAPRRDRGNAQHPTAWHPQHPRSQHRAKGKGEAGRQNQGPGRIWAEGQLPWNQLRTWTGGQRPWKGPYQ